ncbi:uncharacterized protein LOC106475606 [Limulus polyphemus]|uniref:Uncharacterized protein LOC106475606 n=1 Tax=Limulus polyphemus TaxID=6850 RepID=A0ABM1RVH7_LIMPO|nr:uncharacterized protein LOC106475606 [Limulus polyphemus]XP_013791737.1 uncharacterized protein LOC106475606 [Limulus polyphemus]XP_022235382.1 uncharacterized protein LOC106475606 [Limulus polyphemus]
MPAYRDSSSNPNATTTTVVTRRVEPTPPVELTPNGIASAKHEEWTTSKKVVNHKTRQVETRVQRQLVYEDGKVVADSGPQISTKTTEDNRTEEMENRDHKTTGGEDTGSDYAPVPGSARVITEKTETRQTTRENKEEDMQLHDETFQELTGTDLHQKALTAPDDGFFSQEIDVSKPYPGKITHYSCRGQKVTDKEEVNEVSEWKDGEITTETTTTRHHEEQHDDEVPEDEIDEATIPEISKETTNNIEYYGDYTNQESLSERLRREREQRIRKELFPERQNTISQNALGSKYKKEIMDCERNHGLDNHLDTNSDSNYEPANRKTTKSTIHIKMNNSSESPSRAHVEKDFIESGNKFSRNVQDRAIYDKTKKNFVGVSEWDPRPRKFSEVQSSPKRRESTKSTPPGGSWKNFSSSSHLVNESSPRYESSSLRRQSTPWKSTSSIRDDFHRTFLDDQKKDRHDSFQTKHLSPDRSKVQRSYSHKDASRKFTVYDDSRAPRVTTFNKDYSNSPISQTLPRDTKFKNSPNTSYVYTSVNKSTPQDHDRKDSWIHVDSQHVTLPRRLATHPARVSEERDVQTLPRTHSKKPHQEQRKNSATGTPRRSFYFGDESDVSFHSDGKKKTGQPQSFDESSSYKRFLKFKNNCTDQPIRYHTIERDVRVKDRPQRSSIHLSIGDLRSPHYKSELNRSSEDNIWDQSHYHTVVRRDVSGRKTSYQHTFSNGDDQSGKDVISPIDKSDIRKSKLQPYGKRKELIFNSDAPNKDFMKTTESDVNRRQLTDSRRSFSPPVLMKVNGTTTFKTRSFTPPESPQEAPPRPTPPPPSGGLFDNNTLPKFRSEKTSNHPHSLTLATKVPTFSPLSSPMEIKAMASRTTMAPLSSHDHHEHEEIVVPVRPPRRSRGTAKWDDR